MSTKLEDTKEKITRAALTVFSLKGYASATTREIAGEAGVNEVTLFRHFGSKENLLTAVIERHSVIPVVAQALKSELTGDYRRDLKMIANHLLAVWHERRELMLIMLSEARQHPEEISLITRIPLRLREYLAEYLRSLSRSGQIREIDHDASAQAFINGLFGYFLMLAIFGSGFHPQSTDEYVDNFVDIFARGTEA